MKIPDIGSELVLVETISIDNKGQGIAWDRSDMGMIYTISRKDRQVRAFKMME
jgi:hypothetical protein